MAIEDLATKTQAKAAMSQGLTRDQARAAAREYVKKANQPNPRPERRTVMDGGVVMEKVDPDQFEALKEVARLSARLLEYTEKGGAPGARPTEFLALARGLRDLKALYAAEPGASGIVGGLLDILEALEPQ